MAMITDLKTDYKDDVLDTSANERRKFQMITNDDGTVSFVDVTDYLQTGDSFGASELNAMNERSNEQDALLAITDGERVITPQIAYDELSSCVNPENLIPYPYYETTHTDNGITWTDNGDGTVTANGTATGASVFYMVHNTSEPIQAEKCKYTLNGCPSGGSSSKYAVRLYESTKSLPILCTDIGAGAVFDNSNGNILGIATACVIYKGTTVENLTFKPMLVKGSHKCPYNPYRLSKAKLRADIDSVNSSLTEFNQYTPTPNYEVVNAGYHSGGIINTKGKSATLRFFFGGAHFYTTKYFIKVPDEVKPTKNTNGIIRCRRATATSITQDFINATQIYIDTDGFVWQTFNGEGVDSTWNGEIFIEYPIE